MATFLFLDLFRVVEIGEGVVLQQELVLSLIVGHPGQTGLFDYLGRLKLVVSVEGEVVQVIDEILKVLVQLQSNVGIL